MRPAASTSNVPRGYAGQRRTAVRGIVGTILRSLALFTTAEALAACHPRPAAPPGAAESSAQCLPDPNDRCPVLPGGCPGVYDPDGCPEVVLHYTQDCQLAADEAGTLASIARSMKEHGSLTVLAIRAGNPKCASVVRGAIAGAGVDPGRLETKIGPDHSVSFEVAAWDGTRCGAR